ncbi:hypothetical protein ACEQ8H_001243 [Pleosporales sp. CAS-2024a]
MPSFVFWKNPKSSPTAPSVREPLQDVQNALPRTTANPLSLDLGSFTFEDMERLADCQPKRPLQQLMERIKPSAASTTIGQVDEDASILDDEHIESQCASMSAEPAGQALSFPEEVPSPDAPWLVESVSIETTTVLDIAEAATPSRPSAAVGCSTEEADDWPLRPDSLTTRAEKQQQIRPSSFSIRHTSSPTTASQGSTTTRRLYRPTELNLGSISSINARPQSDLEKSSHLMRNSTTQSKAALQSPTQLLQQRLSVTTKKIAQQVKVRVFVPPQPPRNGCLLPGPAGQLKAFTSTSVRAWTEGGRPAWWCKTDKLVVFDGMTTRVDGEAVLRTRTSKGLSIARRRGDTETVVIPMNCGHCQEMLKRHEWKYDIQVCKRSVCWDCKERCKWEQKQEAMEQAIKDKVHKTGDRERADSVLQGDQPREEDLVRKLGIEQGKPNSPFMAVGGIEERMESA